MKIQFPKEFLIGTSTSACQIEATKGTNWYGLKSRDGPEVDRNIEHDTHRNQDASIIAYLGNAYRFNPNWAKLQTQPYGQLVPEMVEEYRNFMGTLKDKGLKLMITLHHFANPNWFEKEGSWKSNNSPDIFQDYALKMANEFGDLTDLWNTINEPTTHAFNCYLLGLMPPNKKNPVSAIRVLKQQSQAHDLAYNAIKEVYDAPIGVSNSTMHFYPESIGGIITSRVAKKVFLDWVPNMFKNSDYLGISYYGGLPFNPWPISEFDNRGVLDKMGKPHDKMWEYYPQGLENMIIDIGKKYGKPVIVTENGCCTDNDQQRILSIRDHLSAVHSALRNGANVKGYFHWSTFDNFELHFGPSWRFGLVSVDYNTMERLVRPSGEFYSKIAKTGILEI